MRKLTRQSIDRLDLAGLSSAEAQAIAEAEAWSRTHEPIPHQQVLADFGLTLEDWEKLSREA